MKELKSIHTNEKLIVNGQRSALVGCKPNKPDKCCFLFGKICNYETGTIFSFFLCEVGKN
jgi:hypothetical protein